MDIKKIGVIGTGTMGNGIAQVYAQKGFDVIMIDIKQEFLDKAMTNIEGSLQRLVKKERLQADDVPVIMQRLTKNGEMLAARNFLLNIYLHTALN